MPFLPGASMQPAEEKGWPSGHTEQKQKSCDFFWLFAFIKYLKDGVSGTTFMDILELGGHKIKVITFCGIRKSSCIP